MKAHYISELLYRHECVIVPGFGGFLSSYRPARISQETHRFFPPSCNVAFNASLTANDGLLANHVAKSNQVNYREANEQIQAWVKDAFRTLNESGSLLLEDLGVIVLNQEGNLEFEPDLQQNYLGNSFGLPSFVAQVVSREFTEVAVPKPFTTGNNTDKIKRLIPETLKWAAVLAPFVAFTLWGSLNTDQLGNYIHNYSGMFSWVRSTPGKSSVVKATSAESVKSVADRKGVVSFHELKTSLPADYTPAVISYSEVRSLYEKKLQTGATGIEKASSAQNSYFIIGGAFREFENALKLVSDLKIKGYPAAILDTTSKGMYVVSIQGFQTKVEAKDALSSIREEGFPTAWVMHKQ